MPKRRTHKVQVIKYSPYRPTSWRYDRIVELLGAEGRDRFPIRGVDDLETVKGYSFIKKWENIASSCPANQLQDRLAELFPDNPALYFAYDIFLRSQADPCRIGIEARILANQSDETIAQSLCIHDPETISWYEKLFFNVRDRLGSVDYISKQVIGSLLGKGGVDNQDNFNLSAKFFGYFGGEVMLEFVLNGIDRNISPPRPGDTVAEYADAFMESMIRGRSMIVAQQFQVDTYKVVPLLELHAKLIEEHNKAKMATGPKSQLEDVVSALVCAVPWSVGQNREQMLAQTPLGNYISGSAVEPRTQDLLRISAGEEVPHLLELKNRKLPEAKKKRDPDEYTQQRGRDSDS
jgi:hypothetical protein